MLKKSLSWIEILTLEFYVSNFNHLGWFTAVPDLSDSSVSDWWWFVTQKQNNPWRGTCHCHRCRSSGRSPQHAAEICWRRIVKFVGARFVVPHFMKSNPGGSSCCPSVCRALHTLHFPSIYLNLFSPTVGWVSVFWDMCVHRISDVHFQMVTFCFCDDAAEKFRNQTGSWGVFAQS